MGPVYERQQKALLRHKDRERDYQADLNHYEKQMCNGSGTRARVTSPPKGHYAASRAIYCLRRHRRSPTPICSANPRGVLMAPDELAGWFGSFDKYKGAKGGRRTWPIGFRCIPGRASSSTARLGFQARSSFGGRPYRYAVVSSQAFYIAAWQRASRIGDSRRVFSWRIRHAGLSGGPKPTLIPRSTSEVAQLVDTLYELPVFVADGEMHPEIVGMNSEAKLAWMSYFNGALVLEQVELDGDLSAAWSKLEEYERGWRRRSTACGSRRTMSRFGMP